jgi:hypothetical protein
MATKKSTKFPTPVNEVYNPQDASDKASAKLDKDVDDIIAGKRLSKDPVIKTKTQWEIGDNAFGIICLIVICISLCYCHKVSTENEVPGKAESGTSIKIESR